MNKELLRTIAEAAAEWRHEESNVYRILPARDKQSCDRFAREVLDLIDLLGQPKHAGKALPPAVADPVPDPVAVSVVVATDVPPEQPPPVREFEHPQLPPHQAPDECLRIIEQTCVVLGLDPYRHRAFPVRHKTSFIARTIATWLCRNIVDPSPSWNELTSCYRVPRSHSSLHKAAGRFAEHPEYHDIALRVCDSLGMSDRFEDAMLAHGLLTKELVV